MAVVDVDLTEPAADPAAASDGPRAGGVGRGVALMLVGVAVIWVTLDVFVDVSALVRVPVVLAGFAVFYVGLDQLLKRLVGPRVETDLWLSLFWVGLVVFLAVIADLLPLREAQDASKTFTEPILARPDLFSSASTSSAASSTAPASRCRSASARSPSVCSWAGSSASAPGTSAASSTVPSASSPTRRWRSRP